MVASDQTLGRSVLRAFGGANHVITRIRTANSQAVATAIRCGVPLVVFADAIDELLGTYSHRWRVGVTQEQPPALQELGLLALHITRDLALRSLNMTQGYFSLSRTTAERLRDLSIVNMEKLNRAHGSLIRLRCQDDSNWWNRLLIGDRSGGARGQRIAVLTAHQDVE
jgi:hypothetical protein